MTTLNRKALLRNSKTQDPFFRTDMFGDKQPKPPEWLLDRIAEEKLTGGYNTKRSNLCTTCFILKSVNGRCNCTI